MKIGSFALFLQDSGWECYDLMIKKADGTYRPMEYDDVSYNNLTKTVEFIAYEDRIK